MSENQFPGRPGLTLAAALLLPGLALAQSPAAPTKSSPTPTDVPTPSRTAPPAGPTAAEAAQAQWYLRDPQLDQTPGTGTTRTYAELLKTKIPTAVVVAVIDSGIDTTHVDLKPVLWRNPGEIPGNGIDDDKNGYVDDIHGWNFIGGKDGRNISVETLETTRVVAKYGPRFAGKKREQVPAAQRADYDMYQRAKKSYDAKKKELTEEVGQLEQYQGQMNGLITMLKTQAGVEKLDTATLRKLRDGATDPGMRQALGGFYQGLVQSGAADTDALLGQLNAAVKDEGDQLKYSLDLKFDPRKDIVGDNPDDVSQRNYGNNDVTGPDALHGTHVAGIIAAVRNNNLGVQGIAGSPVQVMSVRAVPNGDERDKDVANAIRYAVDNGAQIINMSFGKELSPQRKAVEEAYKYAESKGVLLVHAAGNEDDNLDVVPHYPAAYYLNGAVPTNLLTIGASSPKDDEHLVASFSNYSKKQVDVFAPGVNIFSTLPGSTYGNESGTSMAAPVTAGIAAVLKSYFPGLKATDLKRIIRQSAQVHHTQVLVPGEDGKKADFSTLSATGGVVDLYEAVKLAQQAEAGQK